MLTLDKQLMFAINCTAKLPRKLPLEIASYKRSRANAPSRRRHWERYYRSFLAIVPRLLVTGSFFDNFTGNLL